MKHQYDHLKANNILFVTILLILFKELLCTTMQVKDISDRNLIHSKGKYQSPIQISDKQTVVIENMPSLQVHGFSKQPLPGPLIIRNEGHTVQINLPDKGHVPYVKGALLPGKYELRNFHFHWGKNNTRGSEHVINNQRYPLEMHLVHINSKYRRSMNEAIKHKDGILVIAVLFDLTMRSSILTLKPIIHYLPNVTIAKTEVILKKPSFSLRTLLPKINFKSFYKYQGSLTTPPFSEAVTWIILTHHAKIYNSQLQLFRKLRNENNDPLYDNYRKLQPLNGRIIYKHVSKG